MGVLRFYLAANRTRIDLVQELTNRELTF